MSGIVVESTTDKPEEVAAINNEGKAAAKESKVENKSASSSAKQAKEESADESDPSEKESQEESEDDEREEDSDETEDGGESEQEEEKEEKPKKLTGEQKRINKLTKRNTEKDREIARLNAELALARRGPAESKAKEDATNKAEGGSDEGRPKPENFKTAAEYLEALADYKADKKIEAKLKERDEKAEKKAATDADKKQEDDFRAASIKYAKDNPDFHQLVEDLDFKIPKHVEKVILKSGPEFLHELAKDAEKFEEICSMSKDDAALELGEVRARIKRTPESKKEVKHSKAPPPVKPLNSSAAANTRKSVYDENLPFNEYEKLRMGGGQSRRA